MKPAELAPVARYYRNTGQLALAHYWEDQLAKAGRCKRCGRLLTEPVSVERGIGPECLKKQWR
jgi:hypothetical protein